MMLTAFLACLLFLSELGATSARAEGEGAAGNVDESNQPVAGVKIKVPPRTARPPVRTKSDAEGKWSIPVTGPVPTGWTSTSRRCPRASVSPTTGPACNLPWRKGSA